MEVRKTGATYSKIVTLAKDRRIKRKIVNLKLINLLSFKKRATFSIKVDETKLSSDEPLKSKQDLVLNR